MQCKTCKREMTQLFLSQACDHCDYGASPMHLHRGFVVLKGDDLPLTEYVFRHEESALRWRAASGREGYPVKVVHSLEPFRWHLSRGTLRDVTLADNMFEIFPDHKYEPKPYRAFLAKDE